jgi:hypothetical protein
MDLITDDVARESQFTTKGVIAFLLHSSMKQRNDDDKDRAKSVLCGLFNRFGARELLALASPHRASDALRRLCPLYDDDIGACPHVLDLVRLQADDGAPAASNLIDMLLVMVLRSSQCASVVQWIAAYLEQAAARIAEVVVDIDGDFTALDCADPTFQLVGRKGGAARADEDYKSSMR